MKISKDFIIALKMDARPAYEIAFLAGADPYWLSRVIHGITRIEKDEPKILRIAEILGLSHDEIFTEQVCD